MESVGSNNPKCSSHIIHIKSAFNVKLHFKIDLNTFQTGNYEWTSPLESSDVSLFQELVLCYTVLCYTEILEGVWSTVLHVAWTIRMSLAYQMVWQWHAIPVASTSIRILSVKQHKRRPAPTENAYLKLHSNLYVICNCSAVTPYPLTADNYQCF